MARLPPHPSRRSPGSGVLKSPAPRVTPGPGQVTSESSWLGAAPGPLNIPRQRARRPGLRSPAWHLRGTPVLRWA
ncbi:hypothetical protein E2C01_074393 [Portunus trituberculatus]|uniref:Uncharacterized protein n=1 Tax=Portunus trituberculatus TaxID=210409 RepID=A0A5B7IH54_PORTR|nr:hypothetical protein [Portunus trituberculatus]